MLLSFKVKNYRSFRDESVLNMEAASISDYKEVLIGYGNRSILPVVSIYGKNAGGKTNLIRAFWLGVQFIRNAQRTQHEEASVPVQPFVLNNYSADEPTLFEFNYVHNNVKYTYGFAANKKQIKNEYLYHSPKGQKAKIFERYEQKFSFPINSEKKKKELIKEAVSSNQLFFAVSCTMNYKPCIEAMKWFREGVFFSRNYVDITHHIEKYSEDAGMLKAIVSAARMADLGIDDIKFEINNVNILGLSDLPEHMPNELKSKIKKLMDALESAPNDAEAKLRVSEIKATSYHAGQSKQGENGTYPLDLSEESDGTRRLMALAPAIERTLNKGGIFIVDELERDMHPNLMESIVSRYQNKETNPGGGQLVFTTHNTELLSMELLRRDQVYFVDKDRVTGASELYSMIEFLPRKDENIHKGYLLGKYGAVPQIKEV